MGQQSQSELLNGYQSEKNVASSPIAPLNSDDDEVKSPRSNHNKQDSMQSLHKKAMSIQQYGDNAWPKFEPITRTKSIISAENLAMSKNQDVTNPPPHEEWLQLSAEIERLEVIRNELMKFVAKMIDF